MLRILGRLSIYGGKPSVSRLASTVAIPSGTLEQVGQKRRIPDADSWSYSSPWYRFNLESLDEEVLSFLGAHEKLGAALAVPDPGIRHAMFTLCPVDQGNDEVFAYLLSDATLQRLSALRLALEVSPAPVMPEANYWQDG